MSLFVDGSLLVLLFLSAVAPLASSQSLQPGVFHAVLIHFHFLSWREVNEVGELAEPLCVQLIENVLFWWGNIVGQTIEVHVERGQREEGRQ